MAAQEETKLPLNAENVINEIIKKQGFVDYTKTISMGSNVGDNYIGIVYSVAVTGTKENGSSDKLHLICKLPPTNAARREMMKIGSCFTREALVYNEILPEFIKLQEEKCLTDDTFDSYAKCYAANDIEMEEYIIMEDLRKEGFTMFDRHQKLEVNYAKLIMIELGKLHAFSFALREQKPLIFEKYSGIKDIFFILPRQDGFQQYLDVLVQKALATLPESDVECREKFSAFVENYEDSGFECVNGKLVKHQAVICHGDCWNNNILFKYSEDGSPVAIRFLDWQISRFSSPVLDIVYYIFCCTEKALRDEHYEDLLKIYYDSFSSFLTKLGSNPEKLFPFSDFQDHLKRFGKFGLIMAVMVIQVFVSSSEETPDLDAIAEGIKENVNDIEKFDKTNERSRDLYSIRMRGVIQDMVKLGYI